mmetsp:Transcript_7643/g.11349  ORF Transcript_7643/g.11349 Transcript_7643/m.11349 type:complete len:191 (-) Transcript_7643:239-811(-)
MSNNNPTQIDISEKIQNVTMPTSSETGLGVGINPYDDPEISKALKNAGFKTHGNLIHGLSKPAIGPFQSNSTLRSRLNQFFPKIEEANAKMLHRSDIGNSEPHIIDHQSETTNSVEDPDKGVEMDLSCGIFEEGGAKNPYDYHKKFANLVQSINPVEDDPELDMELSGEIPPSKRPVIETISSDNMEDDE